MAFTGARTIVTKAIEPIIPWRLVQYKFMIVDWFCTFLGDIKYMR